MHLSKRRQYLARIAIVAVAYAAAARGGLALAGEHSSVSAIWAPTGIALAALVLGGPRLWPGVALGAAAANAWTGLPAISLLGITAGNTLEALAGAYLLRVARVRPSLDSVRDVLGLVLVSSAVTLVSAGLGVASLRAGAQLPSDAAVAAFRTWWLGDLGGALLVAPTLLLVARLSPATLWTSRRRLLEAAALLVGATCVALLVFSGSAPLVYLVLPLPAWAALRFGPSGAAVTAIAIATVAVAATANGSGPFADHAPDVGLLLTQTFVCTGAVIGLLLAAAIAERRRAQAELLAAHAALEAKVAERTASLARAQARLVEAHELLRIGSWEWDVAGGRVTWSDEMYRIFEVPPGAHEPTFEGYLARVHPDDRARVEANIATALAGRDVFSGDERILGSDGQTKILATQGQVFRGAGGRPARMVGICQDVTERRQAERALRASEERARRIVEAASDAFVASDERGRIVDLNARAEQLLGWTAAEALGQSLAELIIPPCNRRHHRDAVARYLATGEAPWEDQRLQRAVVCRDGREIPVELTISAVHTEDGVVFHAFMHDISERLRRERFLATEHAVAKVLLEARSLDEARPRVLEACAVGLDWTLGGWWEAAPDDGRLHCTGFWRSAGDGAAGAFERASMTLELAPGVGLPGLAWRTGEQQVWPAHATISGPRRALAERVGLRAGIAVPLRSRGEVVAVLEFFTTAPVRPGDEIVAMMSRLGERVAQFVERVSAENDLREAEERFHRAFEDAGTGMALIGVRGDEAGRLLEVNESLCTILGAPRAALLGTLMADHTHPVDSPEIQGQIQALVEGEVASVQGEGRLLDAAGAVVWISLGTSLIRDADGQPLYRISHLQDITERKRFECQLRQLADHDSLTGLFNRRRFDEELRRELAPDGGPATAGGAVLALDLDNFKYVNDTLGHSAGDEMIVCVTEILRGRLRATDTIARLGGDEFAVLLRHVDEPQARRVAANVLEAIRREAIVTTAKGSRRTTCSVGIALFTADSGLGSEELLVEADIAMYDAKEAGRDQACIYDADSSRQLKLHARMTWADEIRAALQEDRFTLYAQPIIPLQGGTPRHELLVRMIGRDGEVIPPGAFLPVAERFDLVREIDRWVVERAIALLGESERRGLDVRFEVNLSAKSLGCEDLPQHIAALLAEHGADPSRLVFEVTETAAIVNVDDAKQFARRLGELGCGFALDDFGAGFASFYYLKHMPFDFLKIDGEFVASLMTSRTNQLVVQSLVTIARGLGKRTIAEYVGDEETLAMLRAYGVDFAQGFHIGRPRPVEEILAARRLSAPAL